MTFSKTRALAAPMAVLALALTLLAPTTAAHAATKSNPWEAYLWKAGAVCSYDSTYGDGSTDSDRLRVGTRTKKMARVRWLSSGATQTWKLAPKGQMVEPERFVSGATTHLTRETYPTIAQARAKRGSTVATNTHRVTYTSKEAKGFLISGRTMVVTARYRVSGLGEKTLTLPSGAVKAVGINMRLRSISVSNVRRSEVAGVKAYYRSRFKANEGQEWWAKGRGVVLWTFGSADARGKTVQNSCA